MPEPIENPTPATRKQNERTEAKFFEDVEKLIAEAEREGAEYKPPNPIASLANLKAKRAAALALKAANQQNIAQEETARNERERIYQPLRSYISSTVAYTKSAGIAKNDLDALRSISRDISGTRARRVPKDNPETAAVEGGNKISVSQMSYASRADNYAQFIEQYDTLGIATDEDMYKADTHRAQLAAMRASNTSVINAQAAANTSSEAYDKITYTDADSLLNACISAKAYIKSKYKTTGEPYQNIAKTRFIMPSRIR